MNAPFNLPLVEQVSAYLTDVLGDDFDAETFWDTLDGETDVLDIADRVIASMQGDEALAAAIKDQVTTLGLRQKRLTERAKHKKKTLLMILDAAGQKKLERPAATVSRTAGRVSVQITDESEIPSQLMTVKTTTAPDKTAIKKQIEAGEEVPGAALVRGDDTVTVRVA